MDYPSLEIVVVNDGSTDETSSVISDFVSQRSAGRALSVVVIEQVNAGLSAARNVGIAASKGEIIAFTDADCIADADWLKRLAATLVAGDWGAVGGPNLPPAPSGWVQATVAAAPGAPCHVLLRDNEAEHIPGCNMAAWRRCWEDIGGFDERFMRAGDDVDVCWRMMQKGWKIGFSPAAFVWHHRRFTVRAYLSQQAGYGEAEALLRGKHLHRFGRSGGARWAGVVYAPDRWNAFLWAPVVYYGRQGRGLFQTIYPRRDPEWLQMAGSIEWVACAVALALLSTGFPSAWPAGALMLLGTLAAGGWVAAHARVAAAHDGVRARSLLFLLALAQPLVRGWKRHASWMGPPLTPSMPVALCEESAGMKRDLSFWNQVGAGRDLLLARLAEEAGAVGLRVTSDAGWAGWDLLWSGGWLWRVQVKTADEFHGGPKILTRVALKLAPTSLHQLVVGGVAVWWGAALSGGWALGWVVGVALGIAFLSLWQACALRRLASRLVRRCARQEGMCETERSL